MRHLILAAIFFGLVPVASAEQQWLRLEGGEGPGKGKHIVLISGDEEYRSEEALPMLARILAERHGFTCTVLFAIHPDLGVVDPTHTKNIPGLEALDSADLMVIFTRFRDLPDAQMKHIDDYLLSGRPVLGLRTSTHAFKPAGNGPWAHYGDSYGGEKTEWRDGFGRLILGEKWINHHGEHKHESTRGIIAPGQQAHPILRGIEDGAIWGATDVYGVRLPLPGDSLPLVLGQVVKRAGDYDADDLHYGMRPTDTEAVAGGKNDPMMPVAWTKSYQVPGGKPGRVFTSTVGASCDLTNDAARRLLVNAAYWCVGIEEAIPAEGTNVLLVGEFSPTKYEFRTPGYWADLALTPAKMK